MTDVVDEIAESGSPNLRWYQGIPRYAWIVLFVAALGWMFDTFDQHLFTLLRAPSVKELLKPYFTSPAALDTATKEIGTQLTAVFLIGWAAGGFLFGMIGDRLGRTRTMAVTILMYAVFTGLNGLAQTPLQYGICRFLIAMGVGGEFAAGASLVAEVWPNRSRPMALGCLQSLSAVGNICAAITVLILSSISWRWVFFVGALPALLVFLVMRAIEEPEKWRAARDEAELSGGSRRVGSISALFADPILRRNTLAGVLLAMAGVGGAWGIGFFSPELVRSAFKPLVEASDAIRMLPIASRDAAVGAQLQRYMSFVFLIQMIGAGAGMYSYAAVSERVGRKRAMAIVFVLAFFSVQVTFRYLRDPVSAYILALILGYCSLAPFAAYAVYFPELYPTRLRATGIGFCYNFARILAAFAPFALGKLATHFAEPGDPTAGLRKAASIVAFIYVVGFIGLIYAPETKGKPLPD